MTDHCEHWDCPFRADSGYCKYTACVNPQYNTSLIQTDVHQIMNDHQVLISDLEDVLFANCSKYRSSQSCGGCDKCAVRRAINFINRIVKERDAAISDLNLAHVCETCMKSSQEQWELCDKQCNYEWRNI